MKHKFHHLQLTRPLVILDLETTGIDLQQDRIVELAAAKYAPRTRPVEYHARINPQMPISPAASAVHGITDAMVKRCPTFSQIVPDLLLFLEDADLAGFNLKQFDLPILLAEFRRSHQRLDLEQRSVIDVMQIFHEYEPRTLEAALSHYCGRDHEHAHSALGDVRATAEILDAQVEFYSDLPNTAQEIHQRFSPVDLLGKFRLEEGRVHFNFGKYRGQALLDVARDDAGYLDWMLRQDFPEDVRRLIYAALTEAGQF